MIYTEAEARAGNVCNNDQADILHLKLNPTNVLFLDVEVPNSVDEIIRQRKKQYKFVHVLKGKAYSVWVSPEAQAHMKMSTEFHPKVEDCCWVCQDGLCVPTSEMPL